MPPLAVRGDPAPSLCFFSPRGHHWHVPGLSGAAPVLGDARLGAGSPSCGGGVTVCLDSPRGASRPPPEKPSSVSACEN